MKIINKKAFSFTAIKYLLAGAIIFATGCTVTTERDFIHDETMEIRRMLHWSSKEIQLDEPVVLLPDFREFAWKRGGPARLVILAKKPGVVHIKTATLTGPDGKLKKVKKINKDVSVSGIKQRQTTMLERMSNGGFLKGQRVIDTQNYVGGILLFNPSRSFKKLSKLHLEIEASINNGPFKTYRFELRYRERTYPDFVRV